MYYYPLAAPCIYVYVFCNVYFVQSEGRDGYGIISMILFLREAGRRRTENGHAARATRAHAIALILFLNGREQRHFST
jgi:hypothetical protein